MSHGMHSSGCAAARARPIRIATATAGATEGYGDEVIFADGCFVDGATAELSADGPLREPFTVFAQGGTHHMHWAIVLEAAVEAMGLGELRLEQAAA